MYFNDFKIVHQIKNPLNSGHGLLTERFYKILSRNAESHK